MTLPAHYGDAIDNDANDKVLFEDIIFAYAVVVKYAANQRHFLWSYDPRGVLVNK